MISRKYLLIHFLIILLLSKSCFSVRPINRIKPHRHFISSLSVCLTLSTLPALPSHAADSVSIPLYAQTNCSPKLSTASTSILSTSSVVLSKIGSTEEISLLPLKSWISDDFTRGLVSGAVSRASKEILLHPIDTIRARQQINTKKKFKPINNSTSHIIDTQKTPLKKSSTTIVPSKPISSSSSSSSIKENKESASSDKGLFQDLYAGLTPALVGGIPAGALFFAIKDSVKSYLKSPDSTIPFISSLSSSSSTSLFVSLSLSSLHHFTKEESTILSVMAANVFYWMIRSPTEELKTKQQVGQNSTNFASIRYLSTIYQTRGVRGIIQQLYGSYPSNILYALPADILKFLAYEYVSTNIFHAGTGTGVKITGLDAAVAGSISGLIAQILTTPLDVARTRIMTRKKRGEEEEEGVIDVDEDGKKEEDRRYIKYSVSSSINSSSSSSNNNNVKQQVSSSTSINTATIKNKENNNNNNDNDNLSSSTNIFTVIRGLIATEGISSLFRGILPRAARAVGSGAIQFASYEITQNAMN